MAGKSSGVRRLAFTRGDDHAKAASAVQRLPKASTANHDTLVRLVDDQFRINNRIRARQIYLKESVR